MPVTDVNSYTNLANITATQPTTGTTSSSSSTAVTNATNDTLGKDAFLKLLIAELSNQDPLNPMEDREFVSQMATFSSLEQMQNMNKTLESMAEANKFSAVQYIGKAVAFTKGEGEEMTQVAAVVNHVWFDPNGKIVLDTSEGEVNLEDVEGVSEIS
ncbi:MAG: flagellar hook assembly protein FlgD [Synergistaceae bacterium]|nr:flagellar hook assembly protein FlgD [Synergistaceae bacterium]